MLIGQRPPGPLAKLGARRMGKFDGDRFKTQLKLARCRLENLLKQNRNMTGGRRREIATLLQQGQEDRARVNVKYLIRDDYLMEAYELLLTYCDDLIQSAGLIAKEKQLDSDLVMPLKSLLYAAGRIDAPELERIREQIEAKYGKDFVTVNTDVGKTAVDPSLVVKLGIRSPDTRLVDQYLLAIAQIFAVDWQPTKETEAEGGHVSSMGASPISIPSVPAAAPASDEPPPYSAAVAAPQQPLRVSQSPPSAAAPGAIDPTQPSSPPSSHPAVPDFEELQRRFQALKRG